MITDLIKVNIQREVPPEHQAAILPQLKPHYLFSIDGFAATTMLN
jgi:hypothetical protein